MLQSFVVLHAVAGIGGARLDDDAALLGDLSSNSSATRHAWEIQSILNQDLKAHFDPNNLNAGNLSGKCSTKQKRLNFVKQQKKVCMELEFPIAGVKVSIGVEVSMEFRGSNPLSSSSKKLSATLAGSVILSIPWVLSVIFKLAGSLTISSDNSPSYFDLLRYAVGGVIKKRLNGVELQDDQKLASAVETRLNGLNIPYQTSTDWARWAIGVADSLNIFLTSLAINIQTEASIITKATDRIYRKLGEALVSDSFSDVDNEILIWSRLTNEKNYGLVDFVGEAVGADPLFTNDPGKYFYEKALGIFALGSSEESLVKRHAELVHLRVGLLRRFALQLAIEISKLFVGSHSENRWAMTRGKGEGDWKFDCMMADEWVDIYLRFCNPSDPDMTCYDRVRPDDQRIREISGTMIQDSGWAKILRVRGATLCNLFETAHEEFDDLRDYDWQLKGVSMRIPDPILTVMPGMFRKLMEEQLKALNDLKNVHKKQMSKRKLINLIEDQRSKYMDLANDFEAWTDQNYAIVQTLAQVTGSFHTDWKVPACGKDYELTKCAEIGIKGKLLQKVNIERTVTTIKAEMKKIADKVQPNAQNSMTLTATGDLSLTFATRIGFSWGFCGTDYSQLQLSIANSETDKFNVNMESGDITLAGATKAEEPTLAATIFPWGPPTRANLLGGTGISMVIGPDEEAPRKIKVSYLFPWVSAVKETVLHTVMEKANMVQDFLPLVFDAISVLVYGTPHDQGTDIYKEVLKAERDAPAGSAESTFKDKVLGFSSDVELFWHKKTQIALWLGNEIIADWQLAPSIKGASIKLHISLTTSPKEKALGIQLEMMTQFGTGGEGGTLFSDFLNGVRQAQMQLFDITVGDGTFIDLTGLLLNGLCPN